MSILHCSSEVLHCSELPLLENSSTAKYHHIYTKNYLARQILYTKFWDDIVQRVNERRMELQGKFKDE